MLFACDFCDYHRSSFVIGVWLLPTYRDHSSHSQQRAMWTCLTMLANLTVCLLGWWKCFANNYLQWAAVFTWFFINIQGVCVCVTRTDSPDEACGRDDVRFFRFSFLFFSYRFRVGKLRPRISGGSGVVRVVHSVRHLRHVAAAVEMVHTSRLFDRPFAYTHHELHEIVKRKSNRPA